MKSTFCKAKSLILAMITIVAMLLSGCASQGASEVLSLEVTIPSWSKIDEVDIVANNWVELGKLATYTGFRDEFDRIFNINTVTTHVGNTKQGCVYTIPFEGNDVQCGNSTMRYAFRNKVFDKYFNAKEVRNGLAKIADQAYTDVEVINSEAITSTLNAYFDLLSEAENDPTYESTLSLTRDQFYTMVCKAGTQVGTISPATDAFKTSVINSTHSDYIQAMCDKAWLSYEDGSLNSETVSKPISKLEAIYLLVNTYFPDEVSNLISAKDTAYGYKDAGDLSTKIGANSVNASKSESGNLLAYMIANPDTGLSEDMFKAIRVAEDLDLLRDIDQKDLTQSIMKDEAMRLLINTYESENTLYGYLTNTEYPDYVVNDNKLVGDLRQPDKVVSYFPEQEEIFKKIKAEVDSTVTSESPTDNLDLVEILMQPYIMSGKLPIGASTVYLGWLASNSTTTTTLSDPVPSESTTKSTSTTPVSKPTTPSKPASKPSTSKPASKPSKPNSNTTKPKSQEESSYVPPEMQDCLDTHPEEVTITGIEDDGVAPRWE